MQYQVGLTPVAAAYLLYRQPGLFLGSLRPTDELLWHAWHIITTPKVFIYAGTREMKGAALTEKVTVKVTYRHYTRSRELMNAYERILWSNTIETELSRNIYTEILESNTPTQVVLDWQERLGLSEDHLNIASYVRTFYNRRNADHPFTHSP